MAKGYLAFVLHAHLPFVRHPEYDSFLEERWFFEALTETYIPLVRCLEQMLDEGVRARVTVSVSPSLLGMLEDPLLQERYERHLEGLLRLCERELERVQYQSQLHSLAGFYQRMFQESLDTFRSYNGRLSSRLRRLHEAGAIQLITTAATHGILPLLMAQPKMAEAQVRVGLDYFESVLGFASEGMWLPECAYFPGLEDLLRQHNIRFFFTETSAIENASVLPKYGVYAPLFTPSGVAAFGRDAACSKEVWSATEGFPGDPVYREFYSDIGRDLDPSVLLECLGSDLQAETGIKYSRITSRASSNKEVYYPDAAQQKAAEHAGVFVARRMAQIEHLAATTDRMPIVVAPFDAELFGHWWFEGPKWLGYVIRKLAFDQSTVQLSTISEYLNQHPVQQQGRPATSTWGNESNLDIWVNGSLDWLNSVLLQCGDRMGALLKRQESGQMAPGAERAMNQCLRELLLAQSSDWPFIISTTKTPDYATRRFKDHVCRFDYLAYAIEAGQVDEEYLQVLEYTDNIFPNIDYRVLCGSQAEL